MTKDKLWVVRDEDGWVVAAGMTPHQAWTQDYGDCVPTTWVSERMAQGYTVEQVEVVPVGTLERLEGMVGVFDAAYDVAQHIGWSGSINSRHELADELAYKITQFANKQALSNTSEGE